MWLTSSRAAHRLHSVLVSRNERYLFDSEIQRRSALKRLIALSGELSQSSHRFCETLSYSARSLRLTDLMSRRNSYLGTRNAQWSCRSCGAPHWPAWQTQSFVLARDRTRIELQTGQTGRSTRSSFDNSIGGSGWYSFHQSQFGGPT